MKKSPNNDKYTASRQYLLILEMLLLTNVSGAILLCYCYFF